MEDRAVRVPKIASRTKTVVTIFCQIGSPLINRNARFAMQAVEHIQTPRLRTTTKAMLARLAREARRSRNEEISSWTPWGMAARSPSRAGSKLRQIIRTGSQNELILVVVGQNRLIFVAASDCSSWRMACGLLTCSVAVGNCLNHNEYHESTHTWEIIPEKTEWA